MSDIKENTRMKMTLTQLFETIAADRVVVARAYEIDKNDPKEFLYQAQIAARRAGLEVITVRVTGSTDQPTFPVSANDRTVMLLQVLGRATSEMAATIDKLIVEVHDDDRRPKIVLLDDFYTLTDSAIERLTTFEITTDTPTSTYGDDRRTIAAPIIDAAGVPWQTVTPVIDSRCVSESREPGKYANWSKSNDSTVKGVVKGRVESPYSDEDAFLIDGTATEAHILSVTYENGDSFGTESGQISVIHVFGNMERAEAAKAVYETTPVGKWFEFEDDFGRVVRMGDPADGGSVCAIRERVDISTYPIA